MKCYRKNGSDNPHASPIGFAIRPSMKCYRKNGSDGQTSAHSHPTPALSLNEVLPKER